MTAGPITGHKFAKVLSDALSEAMIGAQQHGASFGSKHAADARIAEAERWEQEAAEVLRERLGWLLDEDDLDEHTRAHVETLLQPEHFVQIAAVMPAIIGIAWILGSAAMAGPASRLQTISMRNFGDVPFDVGLMIDAASRGRVPESWAVKSAEDMGMDADRVGDLINAQKSFPPLGVLIDLARRGAVAPAAIPRAMEESGMFGNWAELVAQLVTQPVPVELAMRAELQGNLDAGTVKEIMKVNGYDPADHDWIYETEGQPPPIMELIQLWRRGLVTADIVHDAILEGPVKNKYIPAIMQMRDRIPPQETVIALTRRGVFDRAEGIDMLVKNGFSPDLATKMIAYADDLDGDTVRDETKAEIVGAFEAAVIDRGMADQMLRGIGYRAEHAAMLLDLTEAKHDRRLLNEGIARVRAGYIGWKFDQARTVTLLDQLHVPQQMREELMFTWNIEREASSRHLTPAQVIALLKRGSIDDAGAISRLRAAGYSAEDADLMLDLAISPSQAKAVTE